MNKSLIIIIVSIFIFSLSGLSQSLKLRLELGKSINFNSYYSKLFHMYEMGPIETGNLRLEKRPYGNIYDFGLFNSGLVLEYTHNKRNHFYFGVMIGDYTLESDVIIMNKAYTYDSISYIGQEYHFQQILTPVNKYRFEYSRDFGNNKVRFSPLIGISYLYRPFKGELNKSYFTAGFETFSSSGNIYNGREFSYKKYYVALRMSTFLASVGFNIRFHSKKREIMSLNLYYEQGFKALERTEVVAHINNEIIESTISYAYGSGLYLKLSFPIPVYNFKEHKFFMD